MKKTSISIVGSGNVATHFALALHADGHPIRQVLSRSLEHAQLLARRVDAFPINNPQRLDTESDVYLLAVGDDALFDLALDLRFPQSLVLHTSGTTPADVLRPISRHFGVVWSPQTFVRDIAMDYSQMPLCIEGSTPDVEARIVQLFKSITPNLHHMGLDDRRHAHLASVLVSNFTNAINAVAQDLMQQHGLDFAMLRPLAEQTLRKWDYGNLWLQMTGPAVRRDDKTLFVQRRLVADNPELLALYDQLTTLIQSHT